MLMKLASVLLVLLVPGRVAAQHTHVHRQAQDPVATQMPESMRIEHDHIHHALEAATQAADPVGAAARELAAVLGPHFQRENQIALPPLGALSVLADGGLPADGDRLLAMTDSLRRELPGMLEEHVQIDAAARKLEAVARAHGAAEAERMAIELQLHARTEQEVTYPAALVIGDLIRARRGEEHR